MFSDKLNNTGAVLILEGLSFLDDAFLKIREDEALEVVRALKQEYDLARRLIEKGLKLFEGESLETEALITMAKLTPLLSRSLLKIAGCLEIEAKHNRETLIEVSGVNKYSVDQLRNLNLIENKGARWYRLTPIGEYIVSKLKLELTES